MVITYHGGECFKISQGDLTLATNPPSKDSDFKVSKFGADIVLSTTPHDDFDGLDMASIGEKKPFEIYGPGEYDVKGVSVRGFGASTEYGGKKTMNTIYSISFEGLNLCFLGVLGSKDIPQSAKQDLDDIDILFLPVGGKTEVDYSESYKLAVQLEPKLVVPMLYDDKELKNFLKEAGEEGLKATDKLTLKKKDLDGKEGEIVILQSA